jgi:transcription termination factor Rho
MPGDLESKHLSELHEMAAERGIAGFRKLPREQLLERIRAAEGDGKGRERRPRRRRSRRRGGEPAEEKGGQPREEQTRPVTGTLELMPQHYGFLRLGGIEPGDDDVYVSASQIRKCELRSGDLVEGPAREPRRGERHPALVHVEKVSDTEASELGERLDFDGLTPVSPSRPMSLDVEPLRELAFGHRALLVCSPDSPRSSLLRSLVGATPAEAETVVLLVDERPEEVTEWRRRAEGAEVVALAADRRPSEQARISRLALARAKRRVEAGADVVLIVDSLSRLGLAYRDPVDVKTFFGAGRAVEEKGAGTLTIIGTVLTGTGSETDERVYDAVVTTENLRAEI